MNYFQQAKSTLTFNNKIHDTLISEDTRKRVLNWTLNRSEYDNLELYKFLKLLKKINNRRHLNNAELCEEISHKVVKRSKK